MNKQPLLLPNPKTLIAAPQKLSSMSTENPAPPPSTSPSPSPSPSLVPQETIQKAVSALLKWRETKSKSEKPKLLDQDEFLYLILTLKRIPPNPRVNPFKIPLPHPLFGPTSEICLIIDDRPKSKLTKEAVAKKVKEDGVAVSKVLKLSKLRANYKPFEAKRKLCDSYELFLADMGVLHALPDLLGKHFYKQKKIPIGLDLRHVGWKEQVERVISSGLLFLGSGTCSVIRVARLSMSLEEIAENVAAAIEGVAETVPREWNNVRSLHLKLMDSVALPVYQTVPDLRLKIEGLRGEEEAEPEAKKEKKEGGQEERKMKKKKKGRMREVRYMDIELDENEGDVDDNEDVARDLEEIEDEELDVENKKRKQGKDLGLENGAKKKKKLNRSEHRADDKDVAEFSDDKPWKKLSKLTKQGKAKEGKRDDWTKVALSVDNGGKVSGGKKEKRKKSDKLAKVKGGQE